MYNFSFGEKKEEINWAEIKLNLKEIIFLLIISFVSFIIRLYIVQYQQIINGDGIYYIRSAKYIISGDIYGGISTYWSSFYPFLIVIFSCFFSDLEFAARFVSVVAGMLLIIPSYLLIRDFFGPTPAYLGAVLLSIHPSLIESSVWVMTESVYTLIITTIILIGWRALQGGIKKLFLIIGILFGAAFLTKPEAIGIFLLFFILTAIAKFYRQKVSINYLAFVYLILGFTIFFLPYLVLVHEKTGKWIISQKIQSNIPSNNSEKGLLSLTDDGQTTMRDQLFNDLYQENSQFSKPPSKNVSATEVSPSTNQFNIKDFSLKLFNNVKKQLNHYLRVILPIPLVLFVLLGLFAKPENKNQLTKKLYLFSFFFCTSLGYAVTVTEIRYLFSILPILICFASLGIFVFSNWIKIILESFWGAKQKISLMIIQQIILLILVFILSPSILALMEPIPVRYMPYEEKKAGLWIKNQKTNSALIMSSNATVAHYAEAEHIFLPDEEFSKVFEYAKRKNVNYLVISKRRLSDTRNFSIPSVENLPAELKLIYKDEENLDFYILIYQIIY